MLNIFLETILPADEGLGLPSASSLGMDDYISVHQIESQFQEYLLLLEDVAQDLFASTFVELKAIERLKAVEKSKRKDIRLSTGVIIHCLKAYYTDVQVLSCLPSGAVPPFPNGNLLDDEDWTLLGSVYERGVIYRSVEK